MVRAGRKKSVVKSVMKTGQNKRKRVIYSKKDVELALEEIKKGRE